MGDALTVCVPDSMSDSVEDSVRRSSNCFSNFCSQQRLFRKELLSLTPRNA